MEQSTINGSAVSPTRSHEAIVSRRSRNASGVSLVVAALSVAAITLSIASSHVSARTRREPALSTAKLTLEHIGSDSTAFDVLATLVIGPKEVLLWDTQYHLNDENCHPNDKGHVVWAQAVFDVLRPHLKP